MSNIQEPDTEPDEAFSLILGDVNTNPLSLRELAPPPEAPTPENKGQSATGDAGPSSRKASSQSSAASENASSDDAGSSDRSEPHPWLAVQLDTCTITPENSILDATDEAALEPLRQAMLAAGKENVAVVRLNLRHTSISARSLALALDYSRLLRKEGGKRLVLSGCPTKLRELFEAMRLQETHGVASS